LSCAWWWCWWCLRYIAPGWRVMPTPVPQSCWRLLTMMGKANRLYWSVTWFRIVGTEIDTVEPALTNTFFVPADGPYIYFYFNLSTMPTSPQRQQPLKRILTAKKPLGNDQLINDWRTVNTNTWPIFFKSKRSWNVLCTMDTMDTMDFCFMDTFWLCHVFRN